MARRYPQSAYAGYTFCLQNEWTYLARVTPDCASLFGPLERAIREELLPAFLCIGASDITNDFRALLSLSVSLGGFGMRNPVLAAEEMHDTSVDACQLLTNSLVEDTPLDISAHGSHVVQAVVRAKKVRAFREARFLSKPATPAEKRRRRKNASSGCWLNCYPSYRNGTLLSAEEFFDNVRLRFNLAPLNMPQHCDGCGSRMTVEHALQCKKGGLVHIRHDDCAKEFGHLCQLALSNSKVSREPRIHSGVDRSSQGNTNDGDQQNSTSTQQSRQQPTQQQRQQQQSRQAGQQQQQSTSSSNVDETRGDVGVHGFWQRGRPAIFDVRITDTDCRSHRHKAPDKVLADQEKEKKNKYLDACHERRKDFTPLVYSVDGMAGREAKAAEKRLASYLAHKWHRPYSQMVHYVKVRMALSVVRSNSLLIRGTRDRGPIRPFIECGSALLGVRTLHER